LLPSHSVSCILYSHAALSLFLAFTSTASRIPHKTTLKGGEFATQRHSTIAPDEVTLDKIASSIDNAGTTTKKAVKSKQKKKGKANSQMKKRGNSNSKKQISKQTTKKQKEQRVFKPLKDLTLGSSVTGKVVEVCEFGAFVDIGYASRGSRPGTALLHVSQIQDGKVSNVTDVINKGDTIEDARVIKVDYVKGEVGISLRKRRPKRKDISEFKVRDKLIGRVDSVVPYGAFIDIGANVNPLLHISRITGSAIDNIRHYVNEGDSVPVHVIDIDVEKKTMAVSMLDKKADQYLDRRLSQKKRKFFGTAKEEVVEVEVEDESELDYFDKAIQELEVALRGK
jgi:ribosomal protein S1